MITMKLLLSSYVLLLYYFAPLGLQSIVISTCVCLSVCSHNWKNRAAELYQIFFCMLPVAMAWTSSDGNAIRYVLLDHCHAVKHNVMFMRSSPRGGRPTSLGSPLAHKQCCCPGSQEHMMSA